MTERFTDQLMSELLGLIAHDFRNPLSALQSNLSFLVPEGGATSADEAEALSDAIASCNALGDLIDNVELLAQLLGSGDTGESGEVVLAAVAREAVLRHRALAASQLVQVEADPSAEDLGLRVVARPSSLSRALGNLVRNGIQYSRRDAVVKLLGWREGDRCGLLVADAGPRLDPRFIELAFSAEGQGSTKRLAEGRYGRGLGLFSARVAAQLAGAEVASVEPPAGSTNAFLLSAPTART